MSAFRIRKLTTGSLFAGVAGGYTNLWTHPYQPLEYGSRESASAAAKAASLSGFEIVEVPSAEDIAAISTQLSSRNIGDVIRDLVEIAKQAEQTRNAAQDVASRAEERARKAEQQAADAAALLIAAERQLAEWKGAAMFAANAIHEADDQEQWDAVRFVLCAWADTAVEMGGDDPLDKGPLDHEREPGRNGE